MIESHAPKDYICPICLAVKGVESSGTLMKRSDVVCRDDLTTVFINAFFVGKNAGHVIVVPNEHFESIYDMPQEYGHRVFEVVQKMSLAIKETYRCDGITIIQNNEPAGDQHAFHYHAHVFPRYSGDIFYNQLSSSQKRLAEPRERAAFAEKLKTHLS